jgi:hypothetical protein
LGFTIGYGLSSGGTGHRVLIGLFAGLGGYIAAYFVLLAVLTVLGARHRTWERQR